MFELICEFNFPCHVRNIALTQYGVNAMTPCGWVGSVGVFRWVFKGY